MSVETTCQNCGEEHDMRHDSCPACSIKMSIRNAEPPFALYPATGHWPFEVHGERFAVTHLPGLLDHNCWRVSHVETGTAIPNSIGDSIEEARENGKATLANVTPEKLKASVAAIKFKISAIKSQ